MYQVGAYVVKPNTGICKIEDIVLMNLGGSGEKQYYMLLPVGDERAKLYVTVDADRSRLRPVMTKSEAKKLISEIEQIQAIWVPNDKLREQQYKEAFRSNEPEDLVGVIKNLYMRCQTRLAQGKKITSTDERYYRQAEKALYSELAFSLGMEQSEIQGIITETIEV